MLVRESLWYIVDEKRNTEHAETQALNNAKKRQRKGKFDTAENHLLRMIFIIILIFVVCYSPYQGMFLWEYFGRVNSWKFSYHKLLRDYLFIVKCLPVHPICYGAMNSIFARAFSRIFGCRR